MSIEEIDRMIIRGEIKTHHTATDRGYIKLKEGVMVSNYDGRFGKGYKAIYPTRRGPTGGTCANNYHYVEYFVFNGL